MSVPSDIVVNLVLTTAILFGILGVGVGLFASAVAALFSGRAN